MRALARRLLATTASAVLLLAPMPVLTATSAQAATVGIPVACVDSVSGITVTVNDVVSFGSAPSGCSVVNNSSTGNLDRVSASGFVAFAVGSGSVFQLMSNGTTQFLIKVDVTIVAAPTPTPTPTSTTAPTGPAASSSATGGSTPSATGPATPAPTDPPVLAAPDRPLASQQLRPRDITITPGLKPDQAAFFGPDGTPLQLLSLSGDTDGIRVIDDGINYSTRPANWQRLGYGDLCWSYAGYADTQGFVLPVATPPFSTVPANWVLTAAIVGTSSGNVTFLEPTPGQVVDAGGRDVATLTLCAKGYPNATVADAARALRLVSADKGGGQYNTVPGCTNGQATGNKHCTGQPVFPTYTQNLGPTSSATASPSPVASTKPTPSSAPTSASTPATSQPPTASATPAPTETKAPAADALLPVCRATGDLNQPYRRELVRTSQIEPTGGDILFPTRGWTDILPPTAKYPAGQNWLAGAALLFDADCRMTIVKPQPVQTISGTSPGPTASPGPEITGFSPVTLVAPLPQPSFTGYGPVYPWPPLPPVPLTGSGTNLVPTATPTPVATPPTPSPMLTPSPATPTPVATPPSPTPSPTLTPPRPTVTVTPIAQPSFTGFGPVCGSGPCLITPVLSPSIPYTALIDLRPTGTASASATTTASPTATPESTPVPLDPSQAPQPSGSASTSTPAVTGTVTAVLTNGPDVVKVTVPVSTLVKIVATGQATGGSTGPEELANTGASWPVPAPGVLVLLGIVLVGTTVVTVAIVRTQGPGRTSRRLMAVVAATGLALVLGSTAAYSSVAEDRRYADAQAQAASAWTSSMRAKTESDSAIARLEFLRPNGDPRLARGIYVFAGTTDAALAQGPGWYRTTARPGERGNTAIAGHRTGHGSPFADLDRVKVGDQITLTTPEGDVRSYRVVDSFTVAPDESWVLGPDPRGDGASLLTLTTCDPPGVNSERLIVQAELVRGSSGQA